jgi:DNA transposition AAA+ family ATPase
VNEHEPLTTATAPEPGAAPQWTDDARDAAFVDRITSYLAQAGLKQSEFARKIGTNAAYLSDYLKRPDFRYWKEVQTRARQWFAKQAIETEHRVVVSDTYLPTAPSVTTKKALERMSATSEIGIIYGPGGVGKTEGKRAFLSENFAALAWDCKPWTGYREPWALERHLVRCLNLRQVAESSRKRSISDVVEILENTNRPLVIDDAQFLNVTTIDQLAFLNDGTGIPIILIANPSLLPRIDARPDQVWRRFGLRIEIAAEYRADDMIEPGYPLDQIKSFCAQYIDRPSAKLVKLAAQVAAGRGHLGRLDKAMRHVPKLLLKGIEDHAALQAVLSQLGLLCTEAR